MAPKKKERKLIERFNEVRQEIAKLDIYEIKKLHPHIQKFPKGTFCANWGGVSDDGDVFMNDNTACHAGLSSSRPFDLKVMVSRSALGYAGKEDFNSREIMEEYINWMIHDSPYSVAISKEQKVDEVLDNAFMAFLPDAPHNLIAGAMVAHREMWEHPSIIKSWYYLKRVGFNPNFAYALAHSFTTTAVGAVSTGTFNGHCSMNGGDLRKGNVANFILGRYEAPLKKSTEYNWKAGGHSYHSISGLWGIHPYQSQGDELLNMVHLAKMSAVPKNEKTTNVFKANAVHTTVKVGDFAEAFLEVLKKNWADIVALKSEKVV